MVFHALYSGIALAIAFAAASPAPYSPVHSRQSITALSGSQISAFTPYTFFASTAYCQPSTTLSWTCGANCEANPGFIPVASGGDGDGTQFWYVGYDPTLNTVIVAHQGTDFSEIEAALTDADFFLESLSSSLFPGVSSSVEAHNGFADEQAKTASAVLAAVKQAMAAHSTTSIATVGHSLGAALSLLDALYLTLQIPSATVKFFGYGLPRVGNQAFANLIDSTLPNRVSHVNNKEDLVPILPGMFLGFHHPSGEKHIMDDNSWVACPGQDNPSNECVVGDVPNIFDGSTGDHDGPYVILPQFPLGISVSVPDAPSNPPSSADVTRAQEYLVAIWDEKQKPHIDSFNLSRAGVAPGHALPANMGLSQIMALLTNIKTSVTDFNTQLTDLNTKLKSEHAEAKRECAAMSIETRVSIVVHHFLYHLQLRNYHKASGLTIPYEIIDFVDGSDPTQNNGNRLGLPAFTNAQALINLDHNDAQKYLQGYGIRPNRIPGPALARRKRLARIIRCSVPMSSD
ncbi:hypothetical protein D9757_009673 [Collybiopsis confluens]|uniref:Lipase n=1 Tax=Collybiopsis confluens TaxID=2823264 RepID=A0A8H5H1N9_9AGAR|nr:hypothetical protein D9757_009673 [Collybiopsis confluens]